ncbi:MAG TPA: DNA translocase FtsK 4TM domain-containing protein, partial [Fredinandcohnia sp.]|nr:DNA translocase FtsK 4TM domain-containing protein [Fredinandcohnia sp.]
MERARASRLAAKGVKAAPNRRIRQGSAKARMEGARRRTDDSAAAQGERQELLAVAFLASSAFLLLALVSYAPDRDNLVGRAGAFVASQLFAVLGLGAFVVPFACFLGFVRAIRRTTRRIGFPVALSYLVLV